MKEISKLMEYRSGVKVVDATLRDGGLVNNFNFTDEFVKDLYRTNVKAGVDYMEFGYKASKDMFDVNAFGNSAMTRISEPSWETTTPTLKLPLWRTWDGAITRRIL
mgnify:CR=1 FL=1